MSMQHIGVPHAVDIDDVLEDVADAQWIKRMRDDLRLVVNLDNEREVYMSLNMSLWGWKQSQIEKYLGRARRDERLARETANAALTARTRS